MKKYLIILLAILSLIACDNNINKEKESGNTDSNRNYIDYVNPMIGTSKMGHTFPGASAPFGMVQLSPQTNFQPLHKKDGSYNASAYEYCAGYQYLDSIIIGFSHTNFSGTGHSDLGDMLIMATTGDLVLEPLKNEDGSKGFYSNFSHDKEKASPGYYKAELEDYNITAELTASKRVGYHKYTFNDSKDAHIILDMIYNVYHHENKNVWTFIRVENDSLVTGYRQTKGWAKTKKVFFAMQFSKAFSSYGHKKYDIETYDGFYRRLKQDINFPEMAGKNLRAWFNFDLDDNKELEIKFALSPVSTNGALKNLKAEIPHWDFNKTLRETQSSWNRELSCIDIKPINEEDNITFYTALYHTLLSPIIYEDVDGKYRGLDQNIYESDGFTNYTIFSLWDTYRALHPLFNIIKPDRNNDMIKSMLAHHDQSVHNMLPIWSHYANENWCMIGYHATSVIADAIAKGVGDFDIEHALQASVNTSRVSYFDGLGDYIKYGYFPDDLTHSSVSKTLEIAYNDWCIAQIASRAGDSEIEEEYLKRSEYYNNVYDKSVNYMRPKLSDGSFRKNFDPLDTHGQGFIEGNAWNYGLYVPHQLDRMIDMMGGKEAFSLHLDSLFTMELEDKYIDKNEDITRDGIIGNYVHGNEPGHHIAYLYNWTGKPYKTQERVRMIMKTMYGPTVEGLCGNDDAGQMSAWYILSSLGFYPVTPGSDLYAIGSPSVKEATIKLDNKLSLTILTINQSDENVYVEKIEINGKLLEGTNIRHRDIIEGGEIVFTMTNKATLN